MSKRNRQEFNKANVQSAPTALPAPDAGPNAHYANAADDGTPAVPYGPDIGILLCAQTSVDPVALLSEIATAEGTVHEAELRHRLERVQTGYDSARNNLTIQAQADAAVRHEAALSVAAEFIACMQRGATLETANRRCGEVMTEYGLGASAEFRVAVRQAIVKQAGERELPQLEAVEPVLSSDEHVQVCSARPLAGATSGAAYVQAERETGYPPRYKQAWRYPVQEGEGATVLDPALLAEARLALRRPAFPDRLYLPGVHGSGSGSMGNKALALAHLWDEAQQVEERLAKHYTVALQGLQHVAALTR